MNTLSSPPAPGSDAGATDRIHPGLTRRERHGRAAAAEPTAGATGERAGRRTYIRARRGWQALNLRELWRARDLLWIFTARDIKVRYKQTFFGFAWALIVPIVQILVFTIFFGSVLGVSQRVNEAAGRALPYALFALTGQIVWNLFKMTVDGASLSLITNATIIRKIYIPRLVLPLSAVGKPAMDAAVVFVLMLGMTAWYSAGPNSPVHVTPAIALAPLLLAGAAIPALAVGLLVAAITVRYRDLQYVMPVLTSILFFVTPVIYSVKLLPDRFAWLMYLNPVAGFVEGHRAAVIGLPFDWRGLATSFAISVVLLIAGLFYFARAEREFADVA